MLCNYEIKTPCGKTMKNILYKYHKKKCDICKGKDATLNSEALDLVMHNCSRRKVNDLTIQYIKKKGYKKGMLKNVSNNLVNDIKENNDKKIKS